MLTIDIIIVSVMAIFFIIGYRKGLIISLFSLLAFFIAAIGSMVLTQFVIDKLNLPESAQFGPYLAYFFVFIAIFIAVIFFGKLLEKIIKLVQLSFMNRLVGGVFGTIKVIFLVSLLFWLSSQVTFIKTDVLKKSIFYNVFKPIAPAVIEFSTI